MRDVGLGELLGAVQAMVPVGVTVGVADPRIDCRDALFHVEHLGISNATPMRQREFASGRRAAHEALRALGRGASAVRIAPDRAPVWPHGICGSISHCNKVAVAVVAERGAIRSLGIDVEDDAPLSDEVLETILGPLENGRLGLMPDNHRAARAIFSAKEAVYKAQYPLTHELFGFEVLDVELRPALDRFQARFLRQIGPFTEGSLVEGSIAWVNGLMVSFVALSGRP